MDQHPRGLNVKTVWGSVLLGIVYSSLLYCHSTLTGTNSLDGIIGVLLGLYICSHPAANVVDILFFGQGARRRQFSSRRSALLWLALNALILLIGWISIFLGTTRLIVKAD
jgi:membrane-associated protease RseP (regulator of RpoE activity)